MLVNAASCGRILIFTATVVSASAFAPSTPLSLSSRNRVLARGSSHPARILPVSARRLRDATTSEKNQQHGSNRATNLHMVLSSNHVSGMEFQASQQVANRIESLRVAFPSILLVRCVMSSADAELMLPGTASRLRQGILQPRARVCCCKAIVVDSVVRMVSGVLQAGSSLQPG